MYVAEASPSAQIGGSDKYPDRLLLARSRYFRLNGAQLLGDRRRDRANDRGIALRLEMAVCSQPDRW